ncbi:hypothetical protein PV327_010690 [Microctonus hyperodae]|uniref:Uncharacterized protein n=1 Tax=Microctonus hyperodae TaxID=165561 RepID=A0AA39C7Z2_MICHY|nr:hypothetical protein PV327_010690 [Microctonus hyperodae]
MLKFTLSLAMFCVVLYMIDAKPAEDCRGENKYGVICNELLNRNHPCPEGYIRMSNNECREVISENYKCPDGYTRISTGDSLLDENHQCPEGYIRISNSECRKVLSKDYECPEGYARLGTGGCYPVSANGK